MFNLNAGSPWETRIARFFPRLACRLYCCRTDAVVYCCDRCREWR